MVGYSPRGRKESNMTEQLHFTLATKQQQYFLSNSMLVSTVQQSEAAIDR